MSAPVTVSITRTISPGHHDEMVAWIRAGSALAARFEGFLGSGWVRPSTRLGGVAHALPLRRRRLARDLGGLPAAASGGSAPRRAWSASRSVERRTGIEGWFDPPATYDVEDLRPAAAGAAAVEAGDA